MRYISFFLLITIFFAGIPKKGYGQVDLIELKKKEEERRKRSEKSKNVVDNSNISSVQGSGKPSTFSIGSGKESGSSTSKSSQSSYSSQGTTTRSSNSGDAQYWRSRSKAIDQQIMSLQVQIRQDEAELTYLQTTLQGLRNPTNTIRARDKISEMQEQIKKEKEALQQLNADREAFRREARQSSVPPGWLRD